MHRSLCRIMRTLRKRGPAKKSMGKNRKSRHRRRLEVHLFPQSQRPVCDALIYDTGPLGAIVVFFRNQAAVAQLAAVAGPVPPRVTMKDGNLGHAPPF